jgi:very-short-patch-repair endonuclease
MDPLRTRARALRNAATDAERRLWQWLRGAALDGARFRRQVPLGGYIADFLCPRLRLVVELDGGQHNDAGQADYDTRRTAAFAARGYRVLRYWNHEVMRDTEAVVADILRAVSQTRHPSPTLPFACGEREGAEPE